MTLASILTTFCRRRAAFPAASPISSTSPSSSTPVTGSVLQTPSRQLSYAFKKTKNDDALIRDKRTFSSDSSPRSALPVSACLGIVVLAAQTEDEKEDPVATDDDALVMEVKKAKLNEARENFTLAEEHYHAALKISEAQRKAGVADDKTALSHRAWILDAMANMAMGEHKPYKAEKLFKEVIQILITLGAPETSPAVLEISIKLANMFATMAEPEKRKEAEIGFKFAIDCQKRTVEELVMWKGAGEGVPEEAIKEAQALLGWAYQSYGFFLLEERRKKEGHEQIRCATEMAKTIYGDDSEAFAMTLNNSASALADKNLFEEATELLETSLAASRGKGWEGEAAFLINLGMIAIHRKLYADAEKHCKAGMDLAIKLKSSEAMDEAASCLTRLKKAMTGKAEPEAACTG